MRRETSISSKHCGHQVSLSFNAVEGIHDESSVWGRVRVLEGSDVGWGFDGSDSGLSVVSALPAPVPVRCILGGGEGA